MGLANRFLVAVGLGVLLGLLIDPLWLRLPLLFLLGCVIGSWPLGFHIGPLHVFERIDRLQPPLAIRLLSWRLGGERDPSRLRWTLTWSAPTSWSLHRPYGSRTVVTFPTTTQRSHYVVLPLVGDLSIIVLRDNPLPADTQSAGA